MAKKIRKFIVELEVPALVTIPEMCSYIEEAVSTWVGGMDPEDPMQELDRENIKVKLLREPK